MDISVNGIDAQFMRRWGYTLIKTEYGKIGYLRILAWRKEG
jgi:hypothetical protein